MESLSDIVAIMRRGTKLPGYWRSCDLNKILAYHADRIEAAWKREKAEIEADALAVGGVVDAARHKPGNAVAMREALELALDALISWLNGTIDRTTNRETIKAIRAALSALPRQCDVGTPEEQKERFDAFCDAQPRTRNGCDCVFQKNRQGLCEGLCEFAWAQMPYAEEAIGAVKANLKMMLVGSEKGLGDDK